MAPTASDTEESPLYGADDFRIYCMKVLPCSKRYCHDWTTCPFAHPGEKARRRDPRVFNYTGIACPDMKKEGACPRREACPYAHNVFEYWLHPTRYRTQLCNDDNRCKRRICFFAHSLEELRVPSCKPFVPPEALAAATPPDALTDAAGNPCDWNQAFGIPKGPGTGAFAGGHTNRGLADLHSKLASLQLAVQSTQPGTKLHQDQEMMINVLSAALRNAYVINSFSAAGPVKSQALSGDLQSHLLHHHHPNLLPHGESLPAMLGSPQQLHPQQDARSSSNPDLLPWQAQQLRDSLAMEYSRMSLESLPPNNHPNPQRMSQSELAFQMGLPDSQQPLHAMSDLSTRMSLDARLSTEGARGIPNLEPAEQQGIWPNGPSMAGSHMAGIFNQQQQLQQQHQQMPVDGGNIFRSSSLYRTDPMPQKVPSQSQPLMQHQWVPSAMGPSLPSASQPGLTSPEAHDSGLFGTAARRPNPAGSSASHPLVSPPAISASDAFGPTIRASLMDHWQQQSGQAAPELPMDQHSWAAQSASRGGFLRGTSRRASKMAVGQYMGVHPDIQQQNAAAVDASARSSDESSRFSLESMRRSIESVRYSGSGRTSSNESANGHYSISGSPRHSDPYARGQDSLFAYQPVHAAIAPMASVPEAEPIASPLPT